MRGPENIDGPGPWATCRRCREHTCAVLLAPAPQTSANPRSSRRTHGDTQGPEEPTGPIAIVDLNRSRRRRPFIPRERATTILDHRPAGTPPSNRDATTHASGPGRGAHVGRSGAPGGRRPDARDARRVVGPRRASRRCDYTPFLIEGSHACQEIEARALFWQPVELRTTMESGRRAEYPTIFGPSSSTAPEQSIRRRGPKRPRSQSSLH